jgi:hypothetical protein
MGVHGCIGVRGATAIAAARLVAAAACGGCRHWLCVLQIDSLRFWIDSIGFGSILSDFGSIRLVSGRFCTVLDRFYPVLDRFYRFSVRFYQFRIDSINFGSILSGFGSILCIRIDSIRFLDRFYRYDSIGFWVDSIGFGSILSGYGSILSVSDRFYRFRIDSMLTITTTTTATTNHLHGVKPDRTSSSHMFNSATIMAASTIRILTVAIAFTTICRHCTAFTSIGLGRTILPPRAVLPPTQTSSSSHRTRTYAAAASTATGNLHGQGSCFLPLLQNDEDYIAPRIVQVRFVFVAVHLFGSLDWLQYGS